MQAVWPSKLGLSGWAPAQDITINHADQTSYTAENSRCADNPCSIPFGSRNRAPIKVNILLTPKLLMQ